MVARVSHCSTLKSVGQPSAQPPKELIVKKVVENRDVTLCKSLLENVDSKTLNWHLVFDAELLDDST